ncbi:unnamed protein product [Bursaphelenchus okinawaensis]|uniref:Apple domain-containing protein n=1 Tax=Bursaphelenchus okinawaensis TaxID=465554 RepID=A0A811KXC4_9BILA|nr:unnamed protein product [Bursaphelenchus okinawaensis]CAG9113770.1 unnamed protein product [Bursaphelenchus okinawaensis]
MLLLVVLLILYTVYGKECSHKSYFIEHKSVVEGRNIATFPASSVDECAQKCSLTSNCDAANFLLNPEDHSICMLVNSSEASGDSLTPLAASVVYSLRQFCTETKDACVPRQWSFEKHHGYDTLDETYILGEISNVTLEQCLNSCLRSKQCEASLYDKKSKQCRLSKL